MPLTNMQLQEMFSSRHLVIEFLDDEFPNLVTDVAADYGEPGDKVDPTKDLSMVILGDYWCKCGDESLGVHDKLETHYPEIDAYLKEHGVEFEWYDEWIVIGDLAYRTQPSFHGWMPSFIDTDDGEFLTKEDDIEDWIDELANKPRYIPSNIYRGTDLVEVGFQQYGEHYERGLHPGQDDDPRVIINEIHTAHGKDTQVIFALDDVGQFDMRFSAWYRLPEEDNEEQ